MALVKLPFSHYAKGAAKRLKAELMKDTPQSDAWWKTCLTCPYYSENSQSPDTGSFSCRLCDCPIVLKARYATTHPEDKCEKGFWK